VSVTLVVGAETFEVEGEPHDRTLLLTPDALREATGWELRAEGLCLGDACVPRRPNDRLVVDGSVDLVAFAATLRRPVAVEAAARIAVLADSPEEHAQVIAEGTAPPFTLPDLDGKDVSLADSRGRKRLLLAWASW